MIGKIGQCVIGATLASALIAAGYFTGQHDHEDVATFLALKFNEDRDGFRLVFSPEQWREILARAPNYTAVTDDRIHSKVNAVAYAGFEREHLATCMAAWVVARVDFSPESGAVVFEGMCATPEEVRSLKSAQQPTT